MNIRDLSYLLAVAEHRSFIKAAESCFISQPTLSMQIKKLEESLGIIIFERNNKRILITDVGQQIITCATRILQDVEHIKELAKTSQDPLAGNFRLGAFPTLAPYILPTIVPLIKTQLSTLRLILIEEKTDTLLAQLKRGELDACLLAGPIQDRQLSQQHLFDDAFKLAVPSQHPLAKKALIEMSDLVSQPLLLLDEGHCLREQALQFCQLSGIEEVHNVRATSLETLRQMVRADTGMTFIPDIAIQQADSRIKYLPFNKPEPKRSIYLVWRKTSSRVLLMESVRKIIVNAYCK